MNKEYNQRIEKVVAYIDKNISKPINLDTLAGVSNFSKYHFSRIFTGVMGISPIKYLNQKTLAKKHYIIYANQTKQYSTYPTNVVMNPYQVLMHLSKSIIKKTPRDVRKKS